VLRFAGEVGRKCARVLRRGVLVSGALFGKRYSAFAHG
jgi:hypothetical protein